MKNQDTPAFPAKSFVDKDEKLGILINRLEKSVSFPGITKREYFAAEAMKGLLSANATYNGKTDDRTALALDAVKFADALLSVLDSEESH